jgi:hypothetical protein
LLLAIHATDFNQKVRAQFVSAEKFSAVQEHCPPEKLFATRYSLSPFTIRQSPVANHPQLTAVAGRVILFMAKRRRF